MSPGASRHAPMGVICSGLVATASLVMCTVPGARHATGGDLLRLNVAADPPDRGGRGSTHAGVFVLEQLDERGHRVACGGTEVEQAGRGGVAHLAVRVLQRGN